MGKLLLVCFGLPLDAAAMKLYQVVIVVSGSYESGA